MAYSGWASADALAAVEEDREAGGVVEWWLFWAGVGVAVGAVVLSGGLVAARRRLREKVKDFVRKHVFAKTLVEKVALRSSRARS